MEETILYFCANCVHFLGNAKRCAINVAPHSKLDATTDASKCIELGLFEERK